MPAFAAAEVISQSNGGYSVSSCGMEPYSSANAVAALMSASILHPSAQVELAILRANQYSAKECSGKDRMMNLAIAHAATVGTTAQESHTHSSAMCRTIYRHF